MPTNREICFETIKQNVPEHIVHYALMLVNDYDWSELMLHFNDEIKDFKLFKQAIDNYINGGMIEYTIGKARFLSDVFCVDKNVLIPRQETSELVLAMRNKINQFFKGEQISIADVCTGSGCIGISIAKMFPDNKYYLTDISPKALEVAKNNAKRLLPKETFVEFLLGNMLEPLKNKVDVIVCNPPYIEDENGIDERTWNQEPHLALLAKPNTYFYEQILKNYQHFTNQKCLLAFEIGEDMEESLKQLINKYCHGKSYQFQKDLYGKPRFLFIKQE